MTLHATQIKASVPIEAVVGRYVRLRKHGKDLLGLCPFHQEKTPSFVVHPNQRFYKCFGCGAAGDVISFLQRIEGARFVEAVNTLAEDFGVDLINGKVRRRTQAERKRNANLASECALYWMLLLRRCWSRVRMAERSIERIIDWACSEDYDPDLDVRADLAAAEAVRDHALRIIGMVWDASEVELASAYMRVRNEALVSWLRNVQRRRASIGILLGASELPDTVRVACESRII